MDSSLNPVPFGVTGELYIGGSGLASGYINQENLESRVFLTNPFCKDPSARLYKTGDLVSYRFDKNIEYHGRIDQQIKLYGYRLELGEIEAVLAKHPLITEAAVCVHEESPGEQILVAYVVLRAGQTLAKHELKRFASL